MAKKYKKKEEKLAEAVSTYLKMQYPSVDFRFDLSADLRLTIGQAVKNKRIQSEKGYPDLFIAEPRKGYCGLFLELKKDRSAIYRKDGSLRKDKHTKKQKNRLDRLEDKGYKSLFACGFSEVKSILDEYLK